MKKSNFLFVFGLLWLGACNSHSEKEHTGTDTVNTTDSSTVPSTTNMPFQPSAQAVLTGTTADTTVSGTARFDTVANGQVKMTLELTIPKMAGKSVAVHIHEHGDCGDKGMMAHGHWNPGQKKHGRWGKGEFHAGDIGNVSLDAKGMGKMELQTDLWTLGGDSSTSILKKALIIHSGKDDYSTQPTGNAGSRIGCGVIQ